MFLNDEGAISSVPRQSADPDYTLNVGISSQRYSSNDVSIILSDIYYCVKGKESFSREDESRTIYLRKMFVSVTTENGIII